jgi:hypothetical protein
LWEEDIAYHKILRQILGMFQSFLFWHKRNFVKWWLWIPLLFASFAFVDRADKRSDIYEIAHSAPRFLKEGTVDDIGIRGRWMRLHTNQGTHRISCEAAGPKSRDTDCLPRERFPLEIKVELVDYHGVWLIIAARDVSGNIILSQKKQFDRIKDISEFSKSHPPEKEFRDMFIFAFIVGGSLALLGKRRQRILEARV